MSTHEDLHGLAAAYAVDGLDARDRERFEGHLGKCRDCRRDITEFRETAVRLARAKAQVPQDELWQRIRTHAATVPQLPPTPGAPDPDQLGGDTAALDDPPQASNPAGAAVLRPRWRTWLPWSVAAVLCVVALTLSAVVTSMSGRMTELEQHNTAVEKLLAAPDTHMAASTIHTKSAQATVFASRAKDTMLVVVKGLPPAPDGMGYQVWYVGADHDMRSAGMLKHSEEGMMTAMASGLGAARQIGLTMEPESGTDQPSSEPMMVDVQA